MGYVDWLRTDFGGQKERKFWPGSNDIGRACNIFHAEHVSGSK